MLNAVRDGRAQRTRRDSWSRPPATRVEARTRDVVDSSAARRNNEQRRGRGTRQPPAPLGARLRVERKRAGLSARELARRLSVSPSLVSQIETGKVQPSVRTLYAWVNALGVSVDELLAPTGGSSLVGPADSRSSQSELEGRSEARHVQRHDSRRIIALNAGVRWEYLTAENNGGVEFVRATYEVGGASSPDGELVRHDGHEFGVVLSGRLQVTVGFEKCVLEAGDSISFSSDIPHRLTNDGDEVVEAVWVVV